MTKTLFLLNDAAKIIGVKPYQLAYAVSISELPEPVLRLGNKRIFTESDVRNAKRYFANKQKSKKEAHAK